MLFDQPYYLNINEARWTMALKVLNEIMIKNNDQTMSTCLDIGCGPGWFAEKLTQWGLSVGGIDGRLELIETAKKRVPQANFYLADVESKTQIAEFKSADLVFCFGLLYHTENPFRVIRNLYQLTEKILFIESMIVPNSQPITWLVEEGNNETQGLTYHAFIPSQVAMVKMLQVAGFSYIYQYVGKIDHEDFIETELKHKRRGVFLASKISLNISDIIEQPKISTPKYNYQKNV